VKSAAPADLPKPAAFRKPGDLKIVQAEVEVAAPVETQEGAE